MRKIKNGDKSIEYYMRLPYTIRIIPEEDKGFFAEIEELPGCMTEGETLEEVMENIREAQELWIETALEIGKEIPLPPEIEKYSGKFLVRVPKYLHRKLVNRARKEGISLNQLIVSLLSKGVEEREYGDLLENFQKLFEDFQETVNAFQQALEYFEWRFKKENLEFEFWNEEVVA